MLNKMFSLFQLKTEAELEARRQELKRKAEEKEMEKANRPKKPRPKSTQPKEWEVESVKGSKEKGDKTFYQVKWIGWPKLTWEPEENLDVSNLKALGPRSGVNATCDIFRAART